MRDWAFAMMVAVIIISIAGCTASGVISSHKTQVEMKRLGIEEMKIKRQ